MPQIRLRDTLNNLRTITRIRLRDTTNTLRTIQRVRVRDATNTLRTVWAYLTATLSSYSVTKGASGVGSTMTVTTGTVTGTVTGGTGPFTYNWDNLDEATVIEATLPTAAATAFQVLNAEDGVLYEGAFTLTVTDSVGAVATTPPVTVSILYNSTA